MMASLVGTRTHPMTRTRIAGLLIAIGVTVLTGFAAKSTAFQDVNLWSYDFLVNHGHGLGPSGSIVVADFDDASFARIHQFPVPRDLIAALIERIAKAHAKVIGLDVLLSEKRSPEQDEMMRQALVRAGNVVLASQSGSGGIPPVEPLPEFCQFDPATYGDCQAGALGFAFINLPIDSDGFIRRMMLFSADDRHSESFPLQIAELYSGIALAPAGPKAARFGTHLVPYAEGSLHTVLIGSWRSEPAPSVSAVDVLDSKVPDSTFQDKIVLIGQSSDAARDREFTPVFRRATANGVRVRLSGTEIHAASIETLLAGTAVKPLSFATLIAVSFLLTCAAVAILLRYAPRYSLCSSLLIVLGCYLVAQVLFNVDHLWFQYLMPQACIAFAVPITLTYQFLQEQLLKSEAMAEREQVMGLFSRYVAPEVAREIWQRRDEVVLAGEERIATVLFSDIRSFTALTAGKPSQIVLAWLNEYLSAMDEVITAEGGFLNKFIGDGLMVLFGVPLSQSVEGDAGRALRCAIRMNERIDAMNRLHSGDPEFPPLKIGIGIHTGPLTCGNVGSRNRLEYSVIGETVNLASRLESLTKDFKTGIVMSEATYARIADRFTGFRDLGFASVRGFEEKIRLYTIDFAVHKEAVDSFARGAKSK